MRIHRLPARGRYGRSSDSSSGAPSHPRRGQWLEDCAVRERVMKGSHLESSVAERKSSEHARHESPPGTHSSGNCRRIALHSLLIPSGSLLRGTVAGAKIRNLSEPPNTDAEIVASGRHKNAPGLCGAGARESVTRSSGSYFTRAISSMQKYPGMRSPYSFLSLLSTENTSLSTGSRPSVTFIHDETLLPAASMSVARRV